MCPKTKTAFEPATPQAYSIEPKISSLIMFPAWVAHGVREVKIEDSNYYDGWGRYAITHFLKIIHHENKSKSDTV